MSALSDLLATRQFVFVDVFTITLQVYGGAQEVVVTTADVPIFWKNQWVAPSGIELQGLKFRRSVGLSVDEQTITMFATRDMLLGGEPWFDAIAAGVLDNATLRRERAFAPDWVTLRAGTITGSVILFDGMVSSVESLGATQCQLKVKSHLNILNQPMPRNSWQASCLHTLFDSGCGLAQANYQANGNVGSGSTVNVINWSGATAGYYWQGTVLFVGGANDKIERTIKLANGYQLFLTLPLPHVPAAGDAFVAYPGCDKTYSTCRDRFANTANNRSFPYIPVPQIAL